MKVGDRITLGEATLTVAAIVQQEPEVAGIVFSLGPKLLLNIDDIPSTNLMQPGNRASWRLLVADRAGTGALDAYRTWLSAEMKPGQRMETVRDLRPEVRQTLERAEKFLGLAALVAVLLAAVAVALAASRYLRRHLDAAAMFRCFGARVGQTLTLFFVQFLVLGIVACAIGVRGGAGRTAAADDAAGLGGGHGTAAAVGRARAHVVRAPASCCCSASRCRRCWRSPTCRRCGCCAATCRVRASAACLPTRPAR